MAKLTYLGNVLAAGAGVAAALALAVLPMSASAGSCIISGETNRVSKAVFDQSLAGRLLSFWRDSEVTLFADRFRARRPGSLISVY